MRQTERIVMLQVIDNQWKDHLLSMDELKQGIGNRAYGQKDPLVEYKKESYELFTGDDGPHRRRDGAVPLLPAGEHRARGPVLPFPDEDEEEEEAEEDAARPDPTSSSGRPPSPPWRTSRATSSARRRGRWRPCSFRRRRLVRSGAVVTGAKTGRNDPCPCGSGKKYKKCHGA